MVAFTQRILILSVIIALICISDTASYVEEFSITQLQSTKFPYASSNDLYMDVCKARGYLADIALSDDDMRVFDRDSVRKSQLPRKTRIAVETLATNGDRKRLHRKQFNFDVPRNPRHNLRRFPLRARLARAATARPERIWENGVIPYEIQANFSGEHKALFKKAMRHWENYTCVSFVEKTAEDQNYIVFTTADCGCCSYVGKRGDGPQAISIGKNCDKFGIVVHELGHVVGFWHEHTRPDRDQFVEIYYKNIQQGQDYNFEKLKGEDVNSLGQSYDYASIMHYARDTFARAMFIDTILPRPDQITHERPEIGQRIRLSPGDISQANLLYRCSKCGKALLEAKGTFTSPEHEDDQRLALVMPLHCQWRITATHGERIALNISQLNIPESPGCTGPDYLEVRDGHYLKSALLGRFCGMHKHISTISSGPRVLIEYRTSALQSDLLSYAGRQSGFRANYEAVCGGEIIADSGFLQSPNYPNEYRINKACYWRLTVPENYQVALIFESFEIENHDECIYDYLEVRDGHANDSSLIGRFCGYTMPSNIKSTSNKMLVKFASDASVEKAGFSLKFIKEFDECRTTNHGCAHRCLNTLGSYKCECDIGFELNADGKRCEDACGGYLKMENGTVTSPNWPNLYPPRKQCIWEIEAHPQYRITLNFTHFDMEGNNHRCEYDSVQVISVDAEGATAKDHGRFCGTVDGPLTLTSETSHLRIIFNSDTSVQKTGFAAIFFTDRDECDVANGGCEQVCKNLIGSYECSCHQGFALADDNHHCKEGGCKFELNAPSGFVASPGYPEEYPSKKKCVWHFVTAPGHRVLLDFQEFEIEPHQDCSYDKLQVYDGSTFSSPSMGIYCGPKAPEKLATSKNELLLYFESDGSVQRKGFKLRYASVCGGRLIAGRNIGYIYSHAQYGGSHYDNKAQCDWTIVAREGFAVFLRISNFQLEDEPNCDYDYVEVYDGSDATAAKVGRYCGDKKLDSFVSSGEALMLRFHSDDTINSKGFIAEYLQTDASQRSSFIATTQRPSNASVRQPLEPLVNKESAKNRRIQTAGFA